MIVDIVVDELFTSMCTIDLTYINPVLGHVSGHFFYV